MGTFGSVGVLPRASMRTDYGDLPGSVIEAFEAAFPESDDPGIAAEIEALEQLFGREMPREVARVLELPRHEALSPTPTQLVAQERPFEALILRAQQLEDCVSLLFPLTNSVYLRRFEGWADLLCNVSFAEGRPAMPFVGWRQDAWAYDLPSFLRIAAARTAFEEGTISGIEELLAPVWGRVGPNDHLRELFYFLEDEGIAARLDHAWGDRPRLRPSLAQWWRHERALFFGFAFIGKYRHPERTAFDNDPEETLRHPQLLRSLGGQLEILCRGWLLEDDAFVERALAATAQSPSVLVRDAHRLFTELRDGRATVGSVDLRRARDTYGMWVRDEQAWLRAKRSTRRAELEAQLEASADGIELVRADWPLAVEVVTASEVPAPRSVAWKPETLELVVDGEARTLRPPAEELGLYLALHDAKTTLSPSGRTLVVDATQTRPTADGRSRENAAVLALHDVDAGTWRVLTNAKGGEWLLAIDDDRWIYRDRETVYLLRDTGETFADATYTATSGQPKSLCIPELGVLVAYGSPDLANGRPVDDRGAPWVRVVGFWRERVGEVAAFPIDAVEIAAQQVDGQWRVGLISADREVAWEIRGLAAAVAAWRERSRAAAEAERAQREAFGPITIYNAIEALDTFVGTTFGHEIQAGVSRVFDEMLERLRGDEAIVAAAKATDSAADFVGHIKGPFATALMASGLGPVFMDFAVRATILDPRIAEVVVQAATQTGWDRLRSGA
jgi:hypothetical protein